MISETKLTKKVQKIMTQNHTKKLKCPELVKKLTPSVYTQLRPNDSYFDAYNRRNVSLKTDGIDRFYEKGIITKMEEKIELDYVVLATGFDIKRSMSEINVIGRNGKSLKKYFDGYPRAYFGCIMPGFPNMISLLGPGSLGKSSYESGIHTIECQLNYVFHLLTLLKTSKSFEITAGAMENYKQSIRIKRNRIGEKIDLLTDITWIFWPFTSTALWWSTLRADKSAYKIN